MAVRSWRPASALDFATGSEFLSFFVAHGIPGAAGAIAISLIIYFLFTKELFNKGQEVSEADQHNILAYYFGKVAGEVFDWFSAILVGGCYLIMLNGAGTTLNQYLDWDPLIGACLMAAASVVTVWFGLRKLTDIIGSIGPFIALFSVIIGIVALTKADFSNVDAVLPTMELSKGFSHLVAVRYRIPLLRNDDPYPGSSLPWAQSAINKRPPPQQRYSALSSSTQQLRSSCSQSSATPRYRRHRSGS